jgi:uncharacterized coiled-coil DUF342 family protein
MDIINVSGNEFDVSEPLITHHTMKKLRQEKDFLNTAIDNLRLEIVDVQKKRDAVQTLIDAAKVVGVSE